LLIFDNADDPTVSLVPFFPRLYRGIILITSRLRTLGELATLYHLELGAMSHEEALATLAKASRRALPVSPRDLPHMENLVNELGGLALALVQAGVYIFNMASDDSMETGSSQFEQYLALFKRERGVLMRREGLASLDEYRRSVYSTLDLSYSLLPSSARDFLHLCSQFHYTSISLAMVLAATSTNFQNPYNLLKRPESHEKVLSDLRHLLCPGGQGTETHIREMVQCLSSFSLVQAMGACGTVILRFHPLVHSWAREMISSGEAIHQYRMAATIVSTCKRTLLPAHEQFIPQHVTTLVEKEYKDALNVDDLVVFTNFLTKQGVTRHVVELSTRAVKILEDELGTTHLMTANGYMALSNAYFGLGKGDLAVEWSMKALKLRQNALGERHPETITNLGALAKIYCQFGRLKEAEALAVDVLRMLRDILGPQHLGTTKALTSLASIYGHLGMLKEAEELQLHALKIQQDSLGKLHPSTLMSAANLAITYQKQGRYKEAEELVLRVLNTRKEVLGEHHPETLRSLVGLAALNVHLGRIQEAEEIQGQVLKIRRKTLGEWHPDTMTIATGLAAIYLSLGKVKEAEALSLKVIKMQREILGERHPETIRTGVTLAASYAHLRKLKEAEELQIRILDIQKEVLGNQHPDTLMNSANLAITYQKMKRFEDAEELLVKVAEIQREVLGEQHPATIRSTVDLACIRAELGKLKEANELIKFAVKVSRENYGENYGTSVMALRAQKWIQLELQWSRGISGVGQQEDVSGPA
jgi:tetratricopeptide (TPR) repeat protein